MATKSQIGAVISVEGARAYQNEMKRLAQYTKQFAAENEALTSTFEKNAKTVGNLKNQREALKKQIEVTTEKLKKQKEEWQKANKLMESGITVTKDMATGFSELSTDVAKSTAELNNFQKELDDLKDENWLTLMSDAWKNTTNKTGEVLVDIGSALTKFVTVPILTAGVASVKTAASFQSSFTGVRKTVDELVDDTGKVIYSYDDLRAELKKIPLETASSYEQVMAVAEAAGQLGVQADQIPKFTKNIIMLSDSTNVAYEDGATNIARFLNIMGESPDTVDKFGSSLVALGNNVATDEASILALSTRLASAGRLAGLSTPEILGLSAAMSAVGLTAEAGGTAMSTTLNLIKKDVAKGGENLEKFAKVAGMSSEEFADKWKTNTIDALQDLLIGMSTLAEDGGEDLLQFMDDVGWSGIRQSDTMRRLTMDYDGLSEAVKLANENYQTNEEALDGSNALTDEAMKRYGDFEAQVSQFKESVRLLAAEIGENLIPVIRPLIDKATELVSNLSEMDDETLNNIIGFAGIVAIAGPVIGAIGGIIIWAAKLKAAFGVLKGAEGIEGLETALSGGAGGGGLIGTLENLAGTVTDKVGPALWADGGFMFTAGTLAMAFGGAYAAADQMDKKMYESAEACEYVASRYHWSEEKVNEFGYTWSENGHLVALTTSDMATSTETAVDDMETDISLLKEMVGQMPKGMVDSMGNRIPEVQQTAHKMVYTAVEEMPAVASETYDYGYELASNFAEGINAGSGLVEDAISGLAGKVRAYIHFSEPDKGPLSDFHTWMPDMMKGLAKGIDDNAYLVESAISRVARSMTLNRRLGFASGGMISVNNSFTLNGSNFDESSARRFADYITDRVNENLGRMV